MSLGKEQKQIQYQSRLGVEILQGCSLTDITEQQRDELKKSLWQHGVVVVKQQNLIASELEEFAKKTFGNLMFGGSNILDPDISPDLQSQYINILGNPKKETEPLEKFAWKWHQDKDGLPRTEGLDMNALYVVMLYAVKVPKEDINGQPHSTQFIDLIEAYKNLDIERQQQLEKIFLCHKAPSFIKEAVDTPNKVHPIVSTHKITNKKGLYLGIDTTIPVGMENNLEGAKNFMEDLFQTVFNSTPIYSHVWQEGDVIFWDNSQIMHRGIPYDAKKYKRIALRLGVVDE
ncbi:TauD/TfdA dioxygenase family protein [Halotia branconii]|uniref:TauD/TfdA family dioxygenase n=1 Tax=Halotia branconii CENA392 TaxID=1539056 RepID=A0AAJ6PCS5_9CYAN|nr:TauD/TfdA family dioxygenase [Halotia branconii]WGV29101.1 TauD/TfdA family dioxygenase [Halotia branconii CENA392]